jgi:diguanylate cyclase (GGDEF)-like protein
MVVVTGLTLVTVVGERGRTMDRLHKAYDELELRLRAQRPEQIDRRPLQEIEEPTRPEKLSPDSEARFYRNDFAAPLRVLIVEDQVADAELMVRVLGRAGYRLDWQRVETKSDYAAAVESLPDIVLADYSVPGFGALEALEFLRARRAEVPLIVVTGELRDEAAVDCIKRGAADYLLKDRLARLPEAVAQALEQKRLRDERELAEDKIKRLNRVYAMLSGINALIVRARDRSYLFEETCRIAVEDGQFGTAWIGTFDPAIQEVTPVAWAGLGAEEIALATSKATTRSDVPEGQGVLGRAIREKRPAFSNDLGSERSGGGKRRQAVIDHGYRSLIVLPLMVEGAVAATLALCVEEPHFFDEEELKLLNQLAGDISFALEHIGKEEKLAYLAHYDVLTGLPNRALFHERLSHQLRIAGQKKTNVMLFLGDVKRFRFINESLGRHSGDALLRELATRIKNRWPDPDNVARITADCFTGVLADAGDEADIVYLLEKSIKEELSQPFKINEKELTVSMTVGIAVFPADGSDADTLFKNAEAALKKAKESGEHFLFYQREMNARVAEILLLENKMRRALDQQQFVLHYQSKIELATGTISGLEALIRWNDPETGLVPPMQFIPLLEETGMILEAGGWAILEALKEYERWSKQGLMPPRIAVNVSPIQLRQKGFVDVVRDALRASGTEPPGLDLEITESLIMEDIKGNIEKLRAVRDLGVNIAIDDFGTGYSSLGYLAKLPVNALKIDRSFIITMAEDRDSMNIVSTIISLAHTLALKVVAEGVDSEEQSRLLKQLKCDQIQGYLFSKPLPAAQVKAKFLGAEI